MTFYNPDLDDVAPGSVVRPKKDRQGKALLYPPNGYDLTVAQTPLTVNANEVAEYQIDLGVSAKSVLQPQAVKVSSVKDVALVPDRSIYVVSAQDTLPVDPKEWRTYGGRITVKINPDTVTATVRVYGASLPSLSPFTIGWDDGGTTFGGLFLVGTGISVLKRTLRIDTGLTDDEVADDITAEIDNPFIQTREQAYDAAHAALCRRLGNYQRVTLNLTGVSGIDGIDSQRPESALGRLAGARIWFDGSLYRIRSAVITPAGITATCEQDTSFGDFDDRMPPGLTFGGLSALHAGLRFIDFDADPLAGGTVG